MMSQVVDVTQYLNFLLKLSYKIWHYNIITLMTQEVLNMK